MISPLHGEEILPCQPRQILDTFPSRARSRREPEMGRPFPGIGCYTVAVFPTPSNRQSLKRCLRLLLPVLLAVPLLTQPLEGHNPGLEDPLFNGGLRGSALGEVLPAAVLDGRNPPLARISGDLDGRGGPELAVVYGKPGALSLALLQRNEMGAWKRLVEFQRPHDGIGQLRFFTPRHGWPQLLVAHWRAGPLPWVGVVEVFARDPLSGDVKAILHKGASSYHLKDLDGDGVLDLILRRNREKITGGPAVYRWNGTSLRSDSRGLDRFYQSEADLARKRGQKLIAGAKRSGPVPIPAMDWLLVAAETLERGGRKFEAYRTYRRIAHLGRVGRELRLGAEADWPRRDLRTREANEHMLRLEQQQAQESARAATATGSVSGTIAMTTTDADASPPAVDINDDEIGTGYMGDQAFQPEESETEGFQPIEPGEPPSLAIEPPEAPVQAIDELQPTEPAQDEPPAPPPPPPPGAEPGLDETEFEEPPPPPPPPGEEPSGPPAPPAPPELDESAFE